MIFAFGDLRIREAGALRTTIHDRHRRQIVVLSLLLPLLGCAGAKDVSAPVPESSVRSDKIDWSRSEPLQVSLTEFSYRPERLSLREGQPYTLRLTNTGSGTHNFTAPEFFRSVVFRDSGGPQPQPGADGTIEILAGKTVDVELAPLRSGTFPLECTKPLHDLLGMSGEIDVR